MLETQLILIETLYEIMCESDDANTVRHCLAALTNTEAGLRYLELHPITL